MSSKGSESGRGRVLLRRFALSIIIIVGLLLTFLLGLWIFHPKFIYHPMSFKHIPELKLMEMIPLSVRPKLVSLTSPDGTKLRAYWTEHPIARETEQKLTTLLFLHGNVGDILEYLEALHEWLRYMPINALFLSYRGYGYSEGKPSMSGIRMDSQTALDYLLSSPNVDPSRIIIYGHSLGGAVALHLAADNPGKFLNVFIENTFLSIPKMVSHIVPILSWASFVVTEVWDNERQLELLKEAAATAQSNSSKFPNFMLISGGKDHIIPPSHMNSLWNQAQDLKSKRPTTMLTRQHFPTCRHSCFGLPGYHDALSLFYYSTTGERVMNVLKEFY